MVIAATSTTEYGTWVKESGHVDVHVDKKRKTSKNETEETPASASFVIVGSTGSHYTVTLGGGRHRCQCMDFRGL